MRCDFLLRKPASTATFFLFFIAAFLIRAGVFYFYIQHEERYCQPDTQSYTMPALTMYHGYGMVNPNNIPVFWRTPGYPAFLAPFYVFANSYSWEFSAHKNAHIVALWIQMLWCSLLPIVLYALAWILTKSLLIAYTLALVGVIHPGFILASTFLLTDGPAQIFFVMFLICLFVPLCSTLRWNPYLCLAGAALALALYTWMRPMGQFVALAAIIVLFFSHFSLQDKIKQSLFFVLVFAALISPWFIRNYQLTGKVFFCPLFGLYFNVFNAPKIRARIENIPHQEAWKRQCKEAEYEVQKEYQEYARVGNKQAIVNEMICMKPAMPWIQNYPHYFIYDWIVEVCKTTFDLYSYQFVSLYHNCFKWDPLVEYLPEKLADTLYKKDLPFSLRLLAYLELLFEILLWLGIFTGLMMLFTQSFRKKFFTLWISCGIMIGAVVCQTGGFGYARLRLPIEPLIIILGLVFWLYLCINMSKTYGKDIRPMA